MGRSFDAEAVRTLRRSYGIPAPAVLEPNETTVTAIATRLGVTRSTVTAWINEGLLTARRAANRYCVMFGPEAEAACRARIATSPWIRPADPEAPTNQDLTPAQVSRHLGISRDAIYNWIRCGHLAARPGPGGRTYIAFTPEIEAACWQRIAQSAQLPAHLKTRALQHLSGDAL